MQAIDCSAKELGSAALGKTLSFTTPKLYGRISIRQNMTWNQAADDAELAREPENTQQPSTGRSGRRPHVGRQGSAHLRGRAVGEPPSGSALPHGPRKRRPGVRGVKAGQIAPQTANRASVGRAGSRTEHARRRGRDPCGSRARGVKTMPRKTVCIETSVVSCLTARPPANPRAAAWRTITAEWWETRRGRFDLRTSGVAIDEAGKGDPEAMARPRRT